MPTSRNLLLAAFWVRATSIAFSADAENAADKPRSVPNLLPPIPALVDFASANGIALSGIAPLREKASSAVNSTVTTIVTLADADAKSYKQWIVQFTLAETTAAERAKNHEKPEIVYVATGADVAVDPEQSAVDLRIMGPFVFPAVAPAKARPPSDKRARALVNAKFLASGVEHGARILPRATGKTFDWETASNPFPPDRVAAGRKSVDALGLSADDERALFSIFPTLGELFSVGEKTPGLREILFELLDKKSIGWSVLMRLGRLEPDMVPDVSGIAAYDANAWSPNLPPLWALPFSLHLNKKPALNCLLFAAPSQPPLRTTAGIVALMITPGNATSKLFSMQVVAASHGALGLTPK